VYRAQHNIDLTFMSCRHTVINSYEAACCMVVCWKLLLQSANKCDGASTNKGVASHKGSIGFQALQLGASVMCSILFIFLWYISTMFFVQN